MGASILLSTAFVIASGWLPLGVIKDDAFGIGVNGQVAYMPDDTPISAFQVGESLPSGNNSAIYVRQWNGTEWVQMGSSLDTLRGYQASNPSIAIEQATGKIYVAYYESTRTNSGPYRVMVKTWDGSDWVNVGDPLITDPANSALTPSITIDSQDRLVVAFTEYDTALSSSQLYVMRWNGTDWTQIGDAVASGLGNSLTRGSLITNRSDQPMIVYRQGNQVLGSRWNGFRWRDMGGPVNVDPGENAYGPQIAMADTGRVYVSWHEHNPGRSGFVTRTSEWRQGSWNPLGANINDTEVINKAWKTSLTVQARRPVVSWVDFDTRDLYVSKYIRGRDTWINARRGSVTGLFGVSHQLGFKDGKFELVVSDADRDLLLLRQR